MSGLLKLNPGLKFANTFGVYKAPAFLRVRLKRNLHVRLLVVDAG